MVRRRVSMADRLRWREQFATRENDNNKLMMG